VDKVLRLAAEPHLHWRAAACLKIDHPAACE